MPLICTVIARGLAMLDAMASVLVSVSVSVSNSTNPCYAESNVTASLTPLSEQMFSLMRSILVEIPLSIIGFWLPVLRAVIIGLQSLSGSLPG